MTNSSFFVPSNRSFGKGSTTTCCPKICKSTVNTSPEPFSKLSLKFKKKRSPSLPKSFRIEKKTLGLMRLRIIENPRKRTQISHNILNVWRLKKYQLIDDHRISYHHGFSIMSVDHGIPTHPYRQLFGQEHTIEAYTKTHTHTNTQSSNISPPPPHRQKTEPENIYAAKNTIIKSKSSIKSIPPSIQIKWHIFPRCYDQITLRCCQQNALRCNGELDCCCCASSDIVDPCKIKQRSNRMKWQRYLLSKIQ